MLELEGGAERNLREPATEDKQVKETGMSNALSDTELEKLAKLGELITTALSCDANGTGLPCRTDRFSAIKSMKEYLEIHDYEITDKE